MLELSYRTLLMRAPALLLPALFFAGCAGVVDMSMPGLIGQQLVVEAPFEDSKEIARKALEKTGFSIAEERSLSEDTWYVIGTLSMSFQSNGQLLRVTLKRLSPKATLAYLYSVRKIATNLTEDLDGVRRCLIVNLHMATLEQQGRI